MSQAFKDWGYNYVVEYLPYKHKVLGSVLGFRKILTAGGVVISVPYFSVPLASHVCVFPRVPCPRHICPCKQISVYTVVLISFLFNFCY